MYVLSRPWATVHWRDQPLTLESRAGAQHHLQDMIAAVISLVCGTRRAVPPPQRTATSSTVSTPLPSTFAPAGAAPAAPSPAATSPLDESGAANGQAGKPAPTDDDEEEQGTDTELDERLPLTIADFHALFAISPALLGPYPNVGAVERMYAIAPPDSDSDSDDSESADGEGATSASQLQQVMAAGGQRRVTIDASAKKAEATSVAAAAGTVGTPSSASGTGSTGVGAGKHPRLSRSRASSFYGINRPVPVSAPATSGTATVATAGHPSGAAGAALLGKPRFVIDPSSRHGVPEGHPSVPPLPSTPQALLPSWLGGTGTPSAGTGVTAGSGTPGMGPSAAAGGPDLSPKSIALRNSLFPELAHASGSAAPAPGLGSNHDATPDGNWTSTDAGDSDSDDEGKIKGSGSRDPPLPPPPHPPTTSSSGASGTGLKIKFGGGTVQGGNQPAGPSGQRLSASAPSGATAADRETGRKLWEVVDSVGLLDGVLPP